MRHHPSRGPNGRSRAMEVGSPILPMFGPCPDTPQVTRACRSGLHSRFGWGKNTKKMPGPMGWCSTTPPEGRTGALGPWKLEARFSRCLAHALNPLRSPHTNKNPLLPWLPSSKMCILRHPPMPTIPGEPWHLARKNPRHETPPPVRGG